MHFRLFFLSLPGILSATLLTAADNLLKETMLTGEAGKMTLSSEFVELDPKQNYQFTAVLKGADDAEAQVGMVFFDKNRNKIWPSSIAPVAGTETVLVKAARQGDTTLFVKNTDNWVGPAQGGLLAFHARKDMSDLPNGMLEYYLTDIQEAASGKKLVLNRPLGRSYPVGTMLRQQRDAGWMTFGVSGVAARKSGNPVAGYLYALNPAEDGCSRIWPGTVYAKFFVNSATPVTLEKMTLVPKKSVPPPPVTPKSSTTIMAHGTVHSFGAAKDMSSGGNLAIQTVYNKSGGFYSADAGWICKDIRQIEVTFKADAPGYLRLSYMCMDKNGQKIPGDSSLPCIQIDPDGKYHTIVWDMTAEPYWQGTVNNWALDWMIGSEAATIGLSKIRTLPGRNLIPDAENLKAGEDCVFDSMFPRVPCKLYWEGKKPAAVSLRGLDHNFKPIDWKITLPANRKSIEFEVPETLVRGVVSIGEGGVGYPVVEPLQKYRRLTESKFGWRGQWIWSQRELGPFESYVWLEKEFELDSDAERAVFSVMADDAGYIYVNGKFVMSIWPFWMPFHADIAKYLVKGKNKITVNVYNGTLNAGLVFNSYIRTSSGREYMIDTDRTWRCNDTFNKKEPIPPVIDKPVVELGDPNTAQPWASLVGFSYAGPGGQLEILSSQPGEIRGRVLAMPPERLRSFKVVLVADDGARRDTHLSISPDSSQWHAGAEVTLRYQVPRWTGKAFSIVMNDDFLEIKGAQNILAKCPALHPAPPQIREARFENIGVRPMLVFGGKKYNPVFWHAGEDARRGIWTTFEQAEGANIHNFRVEADFLHFWKGEGQYDFSKFDEFMDHMLSSSPDAICTVHLYCHMPDWWLAANPDDVSKHYNNAERGKDRDKQALASKKWLKDAEAPIRALIAHIKTQSYADRIWGMSVAENCNGEWFWTVSDAHGNPSLNGYSKGDYATFRSYLKEKYGTNEALAKAWDQPGITFDTCRMPSPQEICAGSVGSLRDLYKDMRLVDWANFRGRALAEAIIALCKVIKNETGGKWLTGAYYGYHTEMLDNTYYKSQSVGHNGFWEAVHSPYVDFFCAPSRYDYRKIGMSDQLMQPWTTFGLHGKIVICEQDQRTAYGAAEQPAMKMYVGCTDTPVNTVSQFHRAFGMSLATGTTFYWYPLIKGSYEETSLQKVFAEQLDAFDRLPPVQGLVPVDVAIVSDRDSVYYTQDTSDTVPQFSASRGLYKRFNELGAAYDSMVIGDLLDKSIAVKPHKLYIMLPAIVLSKEQRTELMKRFEAEKAAVVWLYAAGCDYPAEGPSDTFNADFLGIKTELVNEKRQPTVIMEDQWGGMSCKSHSNIAPLFYPVDGFDAVVGRDEEGRPIVVEKTVNGAVHYYSTLANLPVEFYGKLMDKAGIQRYTAGLGDVVWVGNDVLFLHVKSGGCKSFRLPDNIRARGFIGPYRGTVGNGEPFETAAGQTYGFVLEK